MNDGRADAIDSVSVIGRNQNTWRRTLTNLTAVTRQKQSNAETFQNQLKYEIRNEIQRSITDKPEGLHQWYQSKYLNFNFLQRPDKLFFFEAG